MQVSANIDHLYGTMTSRLDTIGSFNPNDVRFWLAVRRSNSDYEQNADHGEYLPTTLTFMSWLEEMWGVKITMLDSGNYDTTYEIISPDKYTMFVLKYSV
jgi:hypothetical protein